VLVERTFQITFHKPLADSLRCGCTRMQDLSDLAVGFAFIGKEQNSGAIEFPGRVFATLDEVQQECTFFFC
jgi:hypothetical protein